MKLRFDKRHIVVCAVCNKSPQTIFRRKAYLQETNLITYIASDILIYMNSLNSFHLLKFTHKFNSSVAQVIDCRMTKLLIIIPSFHFSFEYWISRIQWWFEKYRKGWMAEGMCREVGNHIENTCLRPFSHCKHISNLFSTNHLYENRPCKLCPHGETT